MQQKNTAILIATFFFEKVTLTTVILVQKPLRNCGYYGYDYFTIMKNLKMKDGPLINTI